MVVEPFRSSWFGVHQHVFQVVLRITADCVTRWISIRAAWRIIGKILELSGTRILLKDDLQGEEGLKSLAPPLMAQTTGANEPILGLGIHQRHRTGATVAIFWILIWNPPKKRPPRAHWGWGPQNLGGQFLGVPDGNSKIAKVTPILCLWCTPSLNMDSIAQAVWAVGGGARDFGFLSLLTL